MGRMPWISQESPKLYRKTAKKRKNDPFNRKKWNFHNFSKVLNFLWYKVLSTQISHSYVKNCDRELETKNLLVLYKEKNRKIPIKSVKMKISKNKKMRFFLMSQGSLIPKIRFLAQKLWSVARVQRHRQTHTKVNTEGTLSGFQDFFLQLIIKDRPNNTEMQRPDL